jgi:hypothetical protein
MNRLLSAAVAALTLSVGVAASVPARAQNRVDRTLTFDAVAPGAAVPHENGVGIFPAVARLDPDGNVAGYEIDTDPSVPPAAATDAALAGGGSVLDALNGPLLLTFDPNVYVNGVDAFSFVLDRWTNPAVLGPLPVLFYDLGGVEVASLPLDASGVGLTFSPSLSGKTFQSVVLPGGATYDNVRFAADAAVPEPGSLALVLPMAGAAAGIAARRRKR